MILQAYERSVSVTQPTNTVHFVIHEEADEYLGAEIYELEDEAVATAGRNAKILKDKHREVFNGVLLPPWSHGKGKEREFLKQSTSSTPDNQPQPPIKPSSATVDPPSAPIHQPSKRADLTPVTQPHATITAPQAPVFVPIDVHHCGFDRNDDDAIMEDESINKPSHQASDSPADKGRKSKPTAAMTSPLSQSADPKAVVDCILATPMTLSLGEVIGASRDVSHHLQELIRTWTNLFVAPDIDAGFDLLVGCPWAHGNAVSSIVERGSATFIVFGSDKDHPLKLCVTEGLAEPTATALMATLQPASFEEDTGTFTDRSSPDSPATGSPITFAPPSPPSETPTSTLLYPNSTLDGIDGTFGLPAFHPVPIITVAPPSSLLLWNL
ncbi:hypothetical protein PISMIDRAFT_9870 [Pisolithus microcarpus 441]|uniref:DUF4100 domain-containing protein n=1 Tax=Pisolithus microcarpus 441 TaxID=765257 RepID=A0A0C9Z771_9AGAM|nr:hypothetical protein PISMIDRAFT_9870 [Pisolithus microcarpus 441]